MALKADLMREVKDTFATQWSSRNGTVVPTDDSVRLNNDTVSIDATVLYADLADSTGLVDNQPYTFAAEIYKTFLYTAGKIIRAEGGTITAYDGDRIMAVFIDGAKNTAAVRTAMKLKWAVANIINPAQQTQYPKSTFTTSHTVGIDTSNLHVAKTGVRGANDLVWVGRAANHAAKLAALPPSYIYISNDVYNKINDPAKISNGKNMWEACRWTEFDGRIIYRSHWSWSID
jgi:class 3 adenylate cyclase